MERSLNQSIKQVHLAAQYLAAAGKSFLEHQEDDSHTNLAFEVESGRLATWPLDEQGLNLAFDYKSFSLIWQSNTGTLLGLDLNGKSHTAVLNWISKATVSLGISEAYNYELHYDLPYGTDQIEGFSTPPEADIDLLLHNRLMVQLALEALVRERDLETAIRIWPHHFDTGGFIANAGSKQIGIGFGMAIPDTLVDDFYLYTSGYLGHDGVDTADFEPLSKGKWRNEGFKGAILPVSGLTQADTLGFFETTIDTYMKP